MNANLRVTYTPTRCLWLRALFILALVALLVFVATPFAHADGTRDLTTNGGKRALTEFRDTTTAGLYRRTWIRVYARAGETINLGSSGMGVASGSTRGDIWLWAPDRITNSQMPTASIASPDFKCSTNQSTKGKLTTRAQEQAGPLPNTGGYDPCVYNAPQAGVYWIAMLGPTGINGTADGSAGTIDAPVIDGSQNAGVSVWDVTVRSGATTISGRVFVDYLAQLSGGNGSSFQIFSTLYAVSSDGFKYRIDLRGLDPNGFILYGNNVGFLDPDGKTPLYHDMVTGDNQLSSPQGGVKQSPATAKLFFRTPSTDLPTTIIPIPMTPSINTVSFSGSAGGTAGIFSVGGQFTYTGNVGGIAEIIISRDGANYDPTLPGNRVLRAVTGYGTNVINWDGKDNAATPFPVGGPYPYRVSMHAGEYHFPLLDAENSANGGPTLTLLNPLGGTCPYASCSTAFYDDRAYTTSTGVTVNPLTAPSGNVPPNPAVANPASGFDSSTSQRKWGDGSSSGFGNWKGLDLWTYFPGSAVQNSLTVVAQQNQDARIQKSHAGVFAIGSQSSYTLRVSNVGSGVINGTVTVNDTLPAGLTYVSAAGTGWTCSANGPAVTCSHPNTSGVTANGGTLPDIALTVSVTAAAAPSVTNTATVSIVSTDQNTANNSASDPTVIDSADLAITKVASPTTVTSPGQQATYTIVVTNNGPSAATGVQVTDVIPAGMTYSSFTTSQGTYTTGNGIWTVGGMPAGSSATLTIVATVNSITCGINVNNTASRTAGSPYDFQAANDSATAGLVQGGVVSLSGVIREAGTAVPLVGATVTVTDSANHVYTVTSGANGAYTFTSTPANPIALGSASVGVSLTGYQSETQAVNITICGANPLDINLGTTNLLVTKDDGVQTAAPDQQLTYAFKVENTGTLAADNVQIVDVFRNDLLIFLSDTSSVTPVVAVNDNQTTRTYTLASPLAAGASFEFTIRFQVKNPLPLGTTSVGNKATASTTSPEADVTNNERQDTDAVAQAPNLKLTKTDNLTSCQAGQTLNYVLTYRNEGNAVATGVTVVDTLPTNVTYAAGSCTPACVHNASAGTLTWSGLSVMVGGSGTLGFSAVVNSGAAAGTVVRNQAAISDDGTHGADPDASNNSAYDSELIVAPQILLEKAASSANTPPNWGDQVTYTLKWTNTSSVTAYNVVISDPLPAGTNFVSASAGCSLAAGTVTCNAGTVAPSATGTATVMVTVLEQTTNATQSAATLSSQSAAGSVVATSSVADAELRLRFTGDQTFTSNGWNANPRAVGFTDEWDAPVAGFGEAHWTDASRINAQWIASTVVGQAYGNYTFFRKKFCLPLNATGLAGTLEVANDDYGEQYVNQVSAGMKIGAGEIQTLDISAGLQTGGNLYAVRLLNNTHGGHAAYGDVDHPGLAYRLTANYAGLAPFAAGPSMVLAGSNMTISIDATPLAGVAPLEYRIDYGDGTSTAWGSAASFGHTYSAAGSYTAMVSARDAYGCTASDNVPVTVQPAGRNLLPNTASASYANAYGVNGTANAAAALLLPSRLDLAISKTSTPNPAYAGEPLAYTLHVTNNGANSVGQVSVADSVPAGLVGPSYSADRGSFDAASNVWAGELAAGESFDLTISGTVDPFATGPLQNTAGVTPINGTDPVAGNNSATDTNNLGCRTDLAAAVTAWPLQYMPNAPETFTVTVTNYGSAGLTGFRLPLSLPPMSSVAYTPSVGSYNATTGEWTGLRFGSVEELTLTVSGTVPQGTTGPLTITATLVMPGGCSDGVASNDQASTTITANPLAVGVEPLAASWCGRGCIRLRWATVSEQDLLGFYVERGIVGGPPAERLTRIMIPAKAAGSALGASYELLDGLASPGLEYRYSLVAVYANGETPLAGVAYIVSARLGLYLPLLHVE